MPLFVKGGVAILYIHVPKTGGSSIEHMFLDKGFRSEFLDHGPKNSFNLYRRCSPQHFHAKPLLRLLRPQRLTFTFMTVRHPLTRLLSEYKMQVRIDRQPLPLRPWLDQWLKRYLDDPYSGDNHFRPQHEFFMPGCSVFRLEKGFGATILDHLSERTGIAFAPEDIAHHNRGDGIDVDPSEIERVRPLVRQFYRQDFATFDYRQMP